MIAPTCAPPQSNLSAALKAALRHLRSSVNSVLDRPAGDHREVPACARRAVAAYHWNRVTISASAGRGRSCGAADGTSDMDEARDLLVVREPQRIEYAAVIGIPFGDPGRRIAEPMRRVHETHGRGTGRKHLLPLGDFHVRSGAADDRDHQGCPREARPFVIDLLWLGIRVLGHEGRRDRRTGALACSPSKTMKRQGASLP